MRLFVNNINFGVPLYYVNIKLVLEMIQIFGKIKNLQNMRLYDTIISNLDNYYYANSCELFMFQQTIASKDIKWKTNLKSPPYKVLEKKYPAIHHLDYLRTIHEKVY